MLSISAEHLGLAFLGVLTLASSVYVVKDECPPNEEYLLCGSACPANCTDMTEPASCSEQCVEGCFCTVGLLRNENGTCVVPEQCETTPKCDENEEFMTCGPFCPATCSQPVPDVCELGCKVGCFCKGTNVRDEASGKCVAAEDCPAEPCLNENEVYDSCNGACESSCSDPEPICNKICIGGCVCAPGLLRNDSGECVSVDKCPKNGTDVELLAKYLNAINKLLHL